VAVITAICLAFMIGFVALVIDVGHLYGVRNELQNAADAAALAGARALFPAAGYPDTGLIPLTEPPFCSLAVAKGRAAAADNQAGGVANLATTAGDVQTGTWDWNSKTFTPDANPSFNVNAVRAIIRRDAVANSPVASWFAFILGVDATPVDAQAVAAVGYLEKTTGAFLPLWIPKHIYDKWNLDNTHLIKASPDTDDNFGWCAPEPQSANAGYLKDAIAGTGAVTSPEMNGGVNLSNGVDASVLQEISKQITASGTEPYYYHTQTGSDGNIQYTVDHNAAGGDLISYPSDYPDPKKAGKPVTGWLTFILVGERVDADGNPITFDPNNPDAGKFNHQGNVEYFMPVIVTDILKEKGAKPIEFYKLQGGTQALAVGGEAGTKKSQIYATKPVLVQ
jgi:hypothetical protein